MLYTSELDLIVSKILRKMIFLPCVGIESRRQVTSQCPIFSLDKV